MRVPHILIAVACAGCLYQKNPADCADGNCSDPSLPFCDVGGEIAGVPNQCIPGDCTPLEVALCRGDVLVRCNDLGTNYDLVQCERGCALGGCVGCVSNTQCGNPSPICDATSQECRPCNIDDECESRVCNAGACEAPSLVVYAHPDGVGTECSQAAPCSASTVLDHAANATPIPTVRLLPGVYTDALLADTATSSPIQVVATDAKIVTPFGTTAVDVRMGAKVSIRNGIVDGSIFCNSPAPASRALLRLRDMTLKDTSGWGGLNCDFELDQVDATVFATVRVADDFALTIDRSRLAASQQSNLITWFGDRGTARITNSVLENLGLSIASTSNVGRRLDLAFSTIVLDQTSAGQVISCGNLSGGTWNAIYENNVIASFGPPPPSGGNAFVPPSASNSANCTIRNNVLFPQPTAIAMNTVANPLFVNQTARDYHLMPTSPAKDAAITGTITSDHDFDGRARPQGATPDIGAFELP